MSTTEQRLARARLRDEKADREHELRWHLPFDGAPLRALRDGFRASEPHWDAAAGRWIDPAPPKLAPIPPQNGELWFDGATGTIRRVADCDDSAQLAEAFPAHRVAQFNRGREAERQYLEHAQEETGMGCSPEEHAEQLSERETLRLQSHEIAARLEKAGTPAYRSENMRLWSYWVHSKTWESIPTFRRICFIPHVAAMVRAPKLAALEYYLQTNPFARFWTFTGGPRCGIPELRERIETLHRRLNRLNAWLRSKFGWEFVFRSTELGTPETAESAGATRAKRKAKAAHKRAVKAALAAGRPAPKWTRADDNRYRDDAGRVETDANGAPLFHPHAHCVLVSMTGKSMPPERWDALIKGVHARWPWHWDAGGLIEDARECCKYVTKPGEMLALSPEHLAELQAALSGLKLVQPLGILRRQIAKRAADEKTLRRYRTPEGMVWREVFDQNKHASDDAEAAAAYAELIDAYEMAEETEAAAKCAPGQDPTPPPPEVAWCRVLARLSPATGPEGIKEPRVIVGGTHRCNRTVLNHPLVERLWASTVQEWEAGRAIRVHTGTPTDAAQRSLSLLADVPERAPPETVPIFAD